MKKEFHYYDEKYELIEKEQLFLFPHRYETILKELASREKGKLLDIGCGEGVLLEKAKKMGFDVLGIDISRKAIETCHRKGLRAIHCDIERDHLPFENTFDVIICAEIIEHLFDFYRFLARVNCYLKKNGFLFLTCPNSSWLPHRFYYVAGKTPTQIQNPTHIRFFSLHYLTRICRGQGFEMEKDLSLDHASVIRWFSRMAQTRFPPRVASTISNLLAPNFIFLFRKCGKAKYADMKPILQELRESWFR